MLNAGALLALVAAIVSLPACGGESEAWKDAERARATQYAASAGRDCTPACRVHDVEPVSPGLWRIHYGSATGYCMLIYLEDYAVRNGPDAGTDNTNCIGEPRPRP